MYRNTVLLVLTCILAIGIYYYYQDDTPGLIRVQNQRMVSFLSTYLNLSEDQQGQSRKIVTKWGKEIPADVYRYLDRAQKDALLKKMRSNIFADMKTILDSIQVEKFRVYRAVLNHTGDSTVHLINFKSMAIANLQHQLAFSDSQLQQTVILMDSLGQKYPNEKIAGKDAGTVSVVMDSLLQATHTAVAAILKPAQKVIWENIQSGEAGKQLVRAEKPVEKNEPEEKIAEKAPATAKDEAKIGNEKKVPIAAKKQEKQQAKKKTGALTQRISQHLILRFEKSAPLSARQKKQIFAFVTGKKLDEFEDTFNNFSPSAQKRTLEKFGEALQPEAAAMLGIAHNAPNAKAAPQVELKTLISEYLIKHYSKNLTLSDAQKEDIKSLVAKRDLKKFEDKFDNFPPKKQKQVAENIGKSYHREIVAMLKTGGKRQNAQNAPRVDLKTAINEYLIDRYGKFLTLSEPQKDRIKELVAKYNPEKFQDRFNNLAPEIRQKGLEKICEVLYPEVEAILTEDQLAYINLLRGVAKD